MNNQSRNNPEAAPKEKATMPKVSPGAEVSLAYLQAPTTWSGVFSSETTLGGTKTPKGLQIFLNESGGLTLVYDGNTSVVPSANVKIALLK